MRSDAIKKGYEKAPHRALLRVITESLLIRDGAKLTLCEPRRCANDARAEKQVDSRASRRL